MKFMPSLDEVKKIADEKNYNVLPVSCEMLSDFTTPIEVVRILKKLSSHCFLLESAQADEKWGRYTFIGFEPKMEINCIDGILNLGDITLKTDNPSKYLLRDLTISRHLRAVLWDIFHTTISHTANPPQSVKLKITRLSKMSI